ncbi:MAG: dicarboxylate/amino acid:cation symporter [Proteobacteria bacterium]|nr:dicarboxylate/amino acid:cation symporter [Pseudomonadota bacterium]
MNEPLQRAVDLLQPRSLRHLSSYLQGLVQNRLWLKVLIGMALGLSVGVVIGPAGGLVEPATGATIGNWLAFPGRLFLAAIQMIVVPLVVASIVRGLAASENLEQLRALGVRVTLFFVVTTALAAAIGLFVGNVMDPGRMVTGLKPAEQPVAVASEPGVAVGMTSIPEVLIDLLPGNPLSAMVEGEMLQIVVFSIVLGVALVSMSPTLARPMLELLGSLQEVCMTVVRWAMRLAPYAVFGLMAQLTSKIGLGAILGLGFYVITVVVGLALMMVVYLIMLRLLVSVRPFKFLSDTRDVLLLAFSTSSSAAVMPLSIKTAEEKLGVRPSITQFVIPLGATINMNGTALYQSVATVFIAGVYGIDLSLASMALVVAMAVGASIGSPATPGVGIVILSMVLGAVGIPAAGVALIMGVDRILDMCRTVINVTGDLVACRLMEKWVGGQGDATVSIDREASRTSDAQMEETGPAGT